MQAVDKVGVTFVNAVLGRGVMNNVVNLTLGVLQFTPDEKEVNPDLAVAARLRMDIPCAKQLYDALGSLLTSIEQAKLEGKPVGANGVDHAVDAGKPN